MRTNITQYLDSTAAKLPQRKAVIEGDRHITFQQLYKGSRTVAAGILNQNPAAINQPIAVYLPKSIDCVLSDLGIIYSGNAYMNLDTKSPKKRTLAILNQIRPAFILTNRTQAADLSEAGIPLLYIEDLSASEMQAQQAITICKRLAGIIDTDPLCIINTSGSTGTPKGVVLNHRSFLDFTQWAIAELKIGDWELIGSLSPAVFDIFSFELCMLMAKGSTMVILPESMTAFPARLLQKMEEESVSFLFWVPTIMVNIANMDLLSRFRLPDLKTVWFAGEVFPTKQFNYWRRCLPGVKFVNLYGPIEITLDCIYYIAERELSDNEPIPIGVPCRNTDVLLLKEDNTRAEQGEEGEICIRGTSLAMGYYRNAEKTAKAFVQNPLNTAYPELIYRTGDLAYVNQRGEYMFKGRKDTLIKHMGYRIELTEVEHIASFALPEIRNCCALYNGEKKEIVLIYESETELQPADARKALAQHCPKYMIPIKYVRLESLPMNTNGKVDRLRVKEILGI